jgi:hypothetical protein
MGGVISCFAVDADFPTEPKAGWRTIRETGIGDTLRFGATAASGLLNTVFVAPLWLKASFWVPWLITGEL